MPNLNNNSSSETNNGFADGYALIIGIANYEKVRKLPEEVLKDAEDIHSVITSPDYCGYKPENVRFRLDKEATAQTIREDLKWLADKAQNDDTVTIFFSGHGGENDDENETGNYLIPYECDPNNLAGTAISGNELTDYFRDIKSERFLVLFDCCYSGGAGTPKDALVDSSKTLEPFLKSFSKETYKQLAQGKGRAIIASSLPNQVSLLLVGMKNSLFTHYLLEAFQGKARTRGDGLVRVFDLFDYVSEKVPVDADQNPLFRADLENNFPVAFWRGGEKALKGSQETLPIPTKVNKRNLRQEIVEHFSLSELKILCADINQDFEDNNIDMKVDLDEFPGGKTEKILDLIEHLDKKRRLSYLVFAVRREFPEIKLINEIKEDFNKDISLRKKKRF